MSLRNLVISLFTCVCFWPQIAAAEIKSGPSNSIVEPKQINSALLVEGLFFTARGVGDGNSWGDYPISKEMLQEARRLAECKPAASDPAGNWGLPLGGFQMSVRFTASRQTNGSPISASVIMRNVADSGRDWPLDRGVPPENIFYELEGGGDKQHSEITPRDIITRSPGLIFSKRIQRKYEVRLDKLFKFTQPGHYRIRCWTEVIDHERAPTKTVQLFSGWASFEIVSNVGDQTQKPTQVK